MMIRPLLPEDDRLAVSRVYAESWKCAYRGIVPQTFLDNISSSQWNGRLEQAGRHNLVLLKGDNIIGTSSYSAARMAEYAGWGEVITLYLLPVYWGRGYGRALLSKTLRSLLELRFSSVYLWTLEENLRARRFYESFGFVNAGIYLDDNIGGKSLREVQYRYIPKSK